MVVRRRKNTRKNHNRKRLSTESLEPRIVLDGTGPAGILPFGFPDSDPGDDPHVDVIGPDATPIEFEDDFAVVDSYLDRSDDVDVFEVDSTSDAIQIAGNHDGDDSDVDVHVFRADGEEIEPEDSDATALTEDPDGFIQCESSTFEFCDIFPTEPDETYFITIGNNLIDADDSNQPNDEANDQAADVPIEYLFEIRRSLVVPEQPVGNPDSSIGEDPHANTRSRSASVLAFENGYSEHIDSFVDTPGDIDVFRFAAVNEIALIHAESFDGSWNVLVEVWDTEANLVADNRGPVSVINNGMTVPSLELNQLELGHHYFISVAAVSGNDAGEYLLDVIHETPAVPQGPDSQIGDDPHADRAGADATILRFLNNGNGLGAAKINSFVDNPDDVDMFRFVASGEWLSTAAFAPDNSVALSLNLYHANGDLAATSDIDRFMLPPDEIFNPYIETELQPGELYFLAISSFDSRAGEYIMHVEQYGSFGMTTDADIGNPDSNRGDDVHADEINFAATQLVFDITDADGVATVDSFIDDASDVDAFKFFSVASEITVSAYAWNEELDFSILVFDTHKNLLASSTVDSNGDFSNLVIPVQPGKRFFVGVRGENRTSGEYIVNVHQEINTIDAAVPPAADSVIGSDPHADTLGPNATPLADFAAPVLSFIDYPNDVDVFRFVGSGGYTLASYRRLDYGGQPLGLKVFDAQGHEVQSPASFDYLPSDAGFQLWETVAGETYFVVVAGQTTAFYRLNVFAESLDSESDGNNIRARLNNVLAALPDIPNPNDRNGHLGDSNFDGSIDSRDFATWHANRFTVGQGPRAGDFNDDGFTDVSDFNIWNDNKFTAPTNIAAAQPNQPVAPAAERAPRSTTSADSPNNTAPNADSPLRVVQLLSRSAIARRHARKSTQIVGDQQATDASVNVTVDTYLRKRIPQQRITRRTASPNQTLQDASAAVDQIFAEFETL